MTAVTHTCGTAVEWKLSSLDTPGGAWCPACQRLVPSDELSRRGSICTTDAATGAPDDIPDTRRPVKRW